jgi:hypothetical protein
VVSASGQIGSAVEQVGSGVAQALGQIGSGVWFRGGFAKLLGCSLDREIRTRHWRGYAIGIRPSWLGCYLGVDIA